MPMRYTLFYTTAKDALLIATHISKSLVMADIGGTQSKSGMSPCAKVHLVPTTSSMFPLVGLLMKTPVLLMAPIKS